MSKMLCLLAVLVACSSSPRKDSDPSLAPSQVSVTPMQGSAAPKITKRDELDECLALEMTEWTDPHGQGQLLEGFGFKSRAQKAVPPSPKPKFGTIDSFSLDSISINRDRRRLTVDDKFRFVFADQEAMAAKNRSKNAANIAPDGLVPGDWLHIQMQGVLHCIQKSPSDPERTMPAVIEIVSARYIASDKISLNGWRFGFKLVRLSTDPNADAPASAPAPTEADPHDASSVTNALCEGNADGAFPILGKVDDSGKYNRDSNTFSFACTKRDIGKCVDFGGYKTGVPQSGQFDYLQACMRMMSADYCGDGSSYTVDDTLVWFWDTNYGGADSELPANVKFEAAWGDRGMKCWAHRRRHEYAAPDCFATTKQCRSSEEAKKMFKGESLIFNESCDPDNGGSCSGSISGSPSQAELKRSRKSVPVAR